MGSGNYVPIIIVLLFLFTAGTILYVFVSPFVDTTQVSGDSWLFSSTFISNNLDTIYDPTFIDFIDTGYEIFNVFGFSGFELKIPIINVLALLPSTLTDFIYTDIVIFSYLPDWFTLPFFILAFISILWSLIKMFLP